MQLRASHVAVAVSILAGSGAALLTSAMAQSSQDTPQAAPPFSATGAVTPLTAVLTGAEEVPGPGDLDGAGTALVTINTETNNVCLNVATTDLAAFTAAHIHTGAFGVAGLPVVDFAPPAGTTGSFSNCVTDPDADVIAADPDLFYVNVHTTEFADGAIRGQLAFRDSDTQLLGTPVRAYDSRVGTVGKMVGDDTRVIDLSEFGVPVGARAALITVTATQVDAAGHFTVYSNAIASVPEVSNVNFSVGEDIANNITVAVDEAGMIKVTMGPLGSAHLIVDVVGYLV